MELALLIEALRSPEAYPFDPGEITVCQTHISVVFLAGDWAYKIKKPVAFSFVDFSTLERRQHFCNEEVRLNRRLAGDIYRGVVPVTRSGSTVQFEGEGETIEWAVKMQRLPESATLRDRLRAGQVGIALVETVARRLAAFHRSAPTSEAISANGHFDPVARIIRDIFTQSQKHVGTTVSEPVFHRLQSLTEEHLDRLRPLIEDRVKHGMIRDCHGDLHLDHIYYFPDRPPPADLAMVDCIEFTERFRWIDVVADLAFPVMDFGFLGRWDLGDAFADAWFRETGDDSGRPLLPLYAAYRATVRGSVEGLKLAEKEVPAAERASDLELAHGYWLVALGELEAPARRPALVLMAGLPGTGKSSLARSLADQAGFTVIRSDLVRKELASGGAAGDIYTQEWNTRTYAECLTRAEELLFQGKRVIVDANFRTNPQRLRFLDAARRWGVRGLILLCRADPKIARLRLLARHGDASDADWPVYEMLSEEWQEPAEAIRRSVHEIDSGRNPEQVVAQAVAVLGQAGLR